MDWRRANEHQAGGERTGTGRTHRGRLHAALVERRSKTKGACRDVESGRREGSRAERIKEARLARGLSG